jgi:hypothetical protein
MISKTRIYRIWISSKNKFKSGFKGFSPESVYKINDYQELAIKIFDKSLKSNNSILIYYPLTGSNYIQVDNIQIVLEGNDLKIIGEDYFYYISIPDKYSSVLDSSFFKHLEKKRRKIEERMTFRMKHSLDSVLEDISKIYDK